MAFSISFIKMTRIHVIKLIGSVLSIILLASSPGYAQQGSLKKWAQDTASKVDSVRMEGLAQLGFAYLSKNLDSASILLDALCLEALQTANEHYQARCYHLNSIRLYYSGDVEASMAQSRKAIAINEKLGLSKHLANSLSMLATNFRLKATYDSTLFYYKKAMKVSLHINDSLALLSTLSNIGIYYSDLISDYEQALVYNLEALKIQEKIANKRYLGYLYLNTGSSLYNTRNFDEAERYFQKGLAVAEKDGDEVIICRSNSLLGWINMEKERNGLAESFFKKAISAAERMDHTEYLWRARTDLAELYRITGKFLQAKQLTLKNLEIVDKLQTTSLYQYSIAKTNLDLASIHAHWGNKELALDYVKQAETVKIDYEHLGHSEKDYLVQAFIEVYEKLPDYEKAFASMRSLKQLTDSTLIETNRKKILALNVEHQTEKKAQQITNLQQKASIQELNLEKKNNQLKGQVIIGSLLLLMVIGGAYLYNRQYKLKRDKASLELEQRFLRSQLNPHFIFNSLIAIQHYLMSQSKEDAGEYLGMFSTLMRQILENSRKEFIALEEEIDTLTHYLELQKLRFNEGFDYRIEVGEDLDEESMMVPPMFAQPFIENALEHGLFRKEGKNEIVISFTTKASNVIKLEITDSGIGVIGNEIKTSGHLSLAKTIAHERLEKMKVSYKSDMKLITKNVTSADGRILGHKVSLELPSRRVAS